MQYFWAFSTQFIKNILNFVQIYVHVDVDDTSVNFAYEDTTYIILFLKIKFNKVECNFYRKCKRIYLLY